MRIEERIRYLLRAAQRAEREGDSKAARLFRRMAEEMKPLEGSTSLPLRPAVACGSE